MISKISEISHLYSDIINSIIVNKSKIDTTWYYLVMFLYPSRPTFRILHNHWEIQSMNQFQAIALPTGVPVSL